MSIDLVTARISQIQLQLAQFATTSSTQRTGSTTAATFADGLEQAAGTSDRVSGADVVAEARKYLGVPYVWGGTSPQGVDCSGLVQLVYKHFGYDLPRLSADQARAGTPVASLAEAQPGDLIAWDNSSRNNGADHIAIYLGDGKMIEAPRTGLDVRITEVPSNPDYIRRILDEPALNVDPSQAPRNSTSMAAVPAGTPYAGLINAAAARTGVPADLIAAVAKQESGFDPQAVSSAGAQGLMQLMPGTADGLGVDNPFDPAQAIDGGARLLASLLDRFGRTDLALAAYNAGPGAVLRYDGIPPYPETQNYVRNVLAIMEQM
ncbi:transglycosylase SLT domain-containing protein [Nocardioides humilatus]|uniref:Transglycosylase SLT domain-containing protein n=1 Tax=Nocardioides humilatus TaxID=2607660 RepID=A0A5B1LAM5_9ACTN|nr:transglycosylase SLT domain-containing protein [Nocardioides humilatus]KAA1417702.1 transglycosylase SLT domain-containing protein [Nocardioides humilatus]